MAKKIKLDEQDMLGSIHLLNKQCEDAWQAMKAIRLPANYKKINKVVLFGMGGSALGIDAVKNLYYSQIKLPILIVNGYNIPAYVDDQTLAILSSYSGMTEETKTAAQKILHLTRKVFVITTGGYLAGFAKKNKLPAYLIRPRYNPCNQPRIAVGYSIISQLSLLNKLGLLKIKQPEINELCNFLNKKKKQLALAAFSHAKKIRNKIPFFLASEFLLGNAHIVANQINENGKNMAAYFSLPEANHHLLEGLSNPKNNKANLFFVLINSHFYHPRNRKRYQITKQVISKNKVGWLEFKPRAKNKFLQFFEVLQWGSYLSFCLAQLNKIDPSPIPWVDYFKNALKK